MKVAEITENIIPIWGRSKGKVVRKYRCTTAVSYTHLTLPTKA